MVHCFYGRWIRGTITNYGRWTISQPEEIEILRSSFHYRERMRKFLDSSIIAILLADAVEISSLGDMMFSSLLKHFHFQFYFLEVSLVGTKW